MDFEKDRIETSNGELIITFIGHGTLMFSFGGKTIHIDPYSEVADYSKLPKADIIFITHEHRDHLDLKAISHIRAEKTIFIIPKICASQIEQGIVMNNGDSKDIYNLKIEAVPAYNIVHKRESGEPFHPKGIGNGYIITFGDKRVYVAGDTEDIPEMNELKAIDIAFLPINLPYTITPEMMARAAKIIRPKILYPYHYGETDLSKLVELMKDSNEIEVRIRKMK